MKGFINLSEVRDIGKKDTPVLEFVGSTDNPVRNGDILRQDWELSNYKKNPVFLYGHDHHGLPIGRAIRVWKDKGGEKKGSLVRGERLLFRIQFVPEEIYPFAYRVFRMYEDAFLSAVSVGFKPHDYRDLSKEERKEYDVDNPWAMYLMKPELYELSSVPVPMDPDSLKQGVGLGYARSVEEMESLANMHVRDIISSTQIDEAKSYFREIGYEDCDSETDPEPEVSHTEHQCIEVSDMTNEQVVEALNALVSAVTENTEAVREAAALREVREGQPTSDSVPEAEERDGEPEARSEESSSEEDLNDESLVDALMKLNTDMDTFFEDNDDE